MVVVESTREKYITSHPPSNSRDVINKTVCTPITLYIVGYYIGIAKDLKAMR